MKRAHHSFALASVKVNLSHGLSSKAYENQSTSAKFSQTDTITFNPDISIRSVGAYSQSGYATSYNSMGQLKFYDGEGDV